MVVVACLVSVCAGHGLLGMNMPLGTVHHPFCPHLDTEALRLNSARVRNGPLSTSEHKKLQLSGLCEGDMASPGMAGLGSARNPLFLAPASHHAELAAA